MGEIKILLDYLVDKTEYSKEDLKKGLRTENKNWSETFVNKYFGSLEDMTLMSFEDYKEYYLDNLFAEDGYVWIRESTGEKLILSTLLKDTIIKLPSSGDILTSF